MEEARSQSFSLRSDMLEALRRMAAVRGESMSFIVREAIRTYIENQEGGGRDAGAERSEVGPPR
jgi:predicted transcriptional regulator